MTRRTRRLGIEALERRNLLAAGMLDPTFGINGIVEDVFVADKDSPEKVVAAFEDSQGRIIVAGRTVNGHGSVAALARYLPDGKRDTSYGQGGAVFLPLSWETVILNDVALTPQDDVMLTGWGAQTASMLAKVRPDGSLDPEFGDGGILEAFPNAGQARAVALAPNGDVLVAGYNSSTFHIGRFTSSGQRVRSFGNLGTAYSTISLENGRVTDLLAHSDGSVVVGVFTEVSDDQVDLLVLRYDANGVWDESFGTAGEVRIPVVVGDDFVAGEAILAETSEGAIVVGSTHKTKHANGGATIHFVLTKVNTDGTLVSTFGDAGETVLRVGGGSGTRLTSLDVGANDSLVVVGHVSVTRLVAARLNADGSYDSDFADGGVFEDTGFYSSFSAGLVTFSDGSILLGFSEAGDIGLARLDATGTIDTTFGVDGYVLTNLLTTIGETRVQSTVALPDGRFLVMEVSTGSPPGLPTLTYDRAIRRYWADGTQDESYGNQGRLSVSEHAFSLDEVNYNTYLVSGEDEYFVVVSVPQKISIARLDNTGQMDSSFGDNGWLTVDHSEWFSYIWRIYSWGDAGFLLISDVPNGEAYVAVRMDRKGIVDTSFADLGVLSIPKQTRGFSGGIHVCMHEDGAMAALISNAAGGGDSEVVLQRWLPNGTLDTQFGEAGQVATPLSSRYGERQLVCLPDGAVLAAGGVFQPDGQSQIPIRLVQFDATGVPVDTFGDHGVATVRIGLEKDFLASLEVDDAGRVVVGLQVTNANQDIAVTRLNSDGSPDTTFGEAGVWQFDGHGFSDTTIATTVVENGDIIVSGYTKTGEETRLLLARLEGDRSGPSSWQNPLLAVDVNRDGALSPNDALRIANEINRNGPRLLPPYRNIREHPDFIDTDGDRYLTSRDVLVTINALNDTPNAEGEQGDFNLAALNPLELPGVIRESRGIAATAYRRQVNAGKSIVAQPISQPQPLAPVTRPRGEPDPHPELVDRAFAELDSLDADVLLDPHDFDQLEWRLIR